MNKITNKAILIAVIIILIFSTSLISLEKENNSSPVEKMTFKIRWGLVKAGQATLEFYKDKKYEGVPANHYLYTAKTSKFVDIFYKVRDRIESYTDPDLTYSIFYNKIHSYKVNLAPIFSKRSGEVIWEK